MPPATATAPALSADSPSQRALSAATAALVVAVACIAMFLPPLLDRTLDSVWRTVLVGVTLGVAVLLHWAFLGIAARHLGRSVLGWVALSLLLFPVGSAAALMLLGWFHSAEAGGGDTGTAAA
ncbi:hypothetical protein ACPOLB_09660 [Rubrivivax sp. RP6-9]|uniref:hypothetical protein n=1 Tax=Rubrivivax sp. RP6-9 TaxID=3415750 RepID=UPI003CC5AFE7